MQAKRPRVSIIISLFNKGEFVLDAVQSAVEQTYQETEIIVVDDGSTDGGGDLVNAAYGQQVRLIRKPNGGPSSALNCGLAASSGEFIQVLDADDILLPEKIALSIERFHRQPELGVVYCRTGIFHHAPDEWQPHELDKGPGFAEGIVWPQIIRECFLASHAGLIRRSELARIGGWDQNLKSCQDWDLWLRLAHAGTQFGFVDDTLALYRQVPGSLSHSAITPHLRALAVARKIPGYARLTTHDEKAAYRERLSWLQENAGRALLLNRQRVRGVVWNLRSIWNCPSKTWRIFMETQSLLRRTSRTCCNR